MTQAMTVQNKKNIRKNRKGFTLIELIVVIAILAILAAIAIPAFTGTLNRAEERADLSTQKVLQSAVRLYQAEYNALPPAEANIYPYIDGGAWPTPEQDGKSFTYNAGTGVVSLG